MEIDFTHAHDSLNPLKMKMKKLSPSRRPLALADHSHYNEERVSASKSVNVRRKYGVAKGSLTLLRDLRAPERRREARD